MSEAKLRVDALVLTIDDVLVDASHSYREVVRQTVQLYLEHAIGLPASDEPLLTIEEVNLLQKVGNFTDYWELAAAFILYFVEMLPSVGVPTFPSKVHVPAIIAYLQTAGGGRLHTTIDDLREKKNIAELAEQISAAGGGIDGTYEALPRENHHLVVDVGEITRTHLVGRIFQEIYLGSDLFEQIYKQPPVTVQTSGYIDKESLLIDTDILIGISKQIPLALISNRPQIEVNYVLQSQNIATYFQAIVSLDDVREAGGKLVPDPWPLLEAIRRIYPTPVHSAFIGTTPDDMEAARAANKIEPFTTIACLAGAHDKEALRQEFEKLKANIILGHPNNLRDLILD
jgi:phosphoglycolate phosphatase-like HAD superfamily hydrolase